MNIKNKIKDYLSAFMIIGIKISYDNVFKNIRCVEKLGNRFSILEKFLPVRMDWYLRYPVQKIIDTGNLLFDLSNRTALKNEWLVIYSKANDREKILLTNMIYTIGIFDNDICRAIICSIPCLKNLNYRYWMTQNISKMTFFMQDGLYDEYFTDRRELIKKCAIDLKLDIPKVKQEAQKYEKLCIVAYLQSKTPMNSEQRLTVMTANRMSKYYDDILVIVLDCFVEGEDDDHKLCTIFKYKSARKDKDIIKQLFNCRVNIHFCNGRNYRKRFQNAIDVIYDYNPTDIIDLSDDYSIISYYYAKDYYTLNMLLRIGATSLFHSAVFWDDSGEISRMLNEKYHFAKDKEIINWGLPEVIPEDETTLNKNDFGIGEKSFVMLTLGHCSKFCSNIFIDELCNFLKEYPDAVWLIVGDKIPDYLEYKFYDIVRKGQVISKPYEKHIVSLCSFCDILLRVDTTGGSGGTAIAAKQGLPIVMTNYYCDPLLWLGLHYSNIDNYTDLFKMVRELHNNADFYRLKQDEAKALVSKAEDTDEKWYRLYKYMKESKI